MIKKQDLIARLKSLKMSHVITMVIFLIIFFGIIYGIVMYQTNRISINEPTLEISYPPDGERVHFETTIIEGQVENTKEVYINSEIIEVEESGKFVKEINLKEGENLITIVAKNNRNEERQTINVTRTKLAESEEIISPLNNEIPKQQVSNLSSSGPGTLWIPEILALSLAGISWYGSKKKLEKSQFK